MPRDHELLKNLIAGRSPGFAALYEKYSDVLFRYALVVSGSRTISEEATQDTFVYVIEHVHMFDFERSPTALGWLYGILRNRVRSLVRDHSRFSGLDNREVLTITPDRLFELSGAVEATVAAILDLSINQREVIVLCGLQELDYATVAGILNIPIGTVRSRLSRARKSLHSILSDGTGYTLKEVRNGI